MRSHILPLVSLQQFLTPVSGLDNAVVSLYSSTQRCIVSFSFLVESEIKTRLSWWKPHIPHPSFLSISHFTPGICSLVPRKARHIKPSQETYSLNSKSDYLISTGSCMGIWNYAFILRWKQNNIEHMVFMNYRKSTLCC